jgi:AsmA protein
MPLAGQLHADLKKQTAKGALSTRFDESNIALKFDVARFSPLDLGFDLEIDRLDVDKYLPPEKPGDSKKGEGVKNEGEGKIDLSTLKGLNVHGNARIGQFQVSNVKATNIKLKIDAEDGKLDIAPHSMNLYEGTLTGAMSVNANGNAVALREDLSGIRINPLLKDLADKDLVDGRGDVKLNVATRGATVTAMKQGLDGTASVMLRDGAFKGINLAQSFREMKALVSSKQDSVQQAKATDKTDFSEMSASFKIANGVAHNEDLVMKSPFLRLGGSGDIDIGHGAMNYLAKASVVGTSGGQGAKDLEHLQGVTVPVRVTGPFDKLAYKIEFAAVAEGALKAKVDEKKQELKQKAKDELIKGLFGK